MRNIMIGLPLLFFSICAFSQFDIVQGPLKVDDNDSVYIKKENDANYPLALYFESNGKGFKVEAYETDGGEPYVETVFFTKIKNRKNVIVLISWQHKHVADNIDGKSYQVYGYKYETNSITINPLIKNDPNLNGLDGEFDGDILSFKYTDAEKIK